MPAMATNPCADTIAGLRRRIDEVLRPLLEGAGRLALVDFPRFSNVGDSAIWLGEVRYLRDARLRLCYTCDHGTHSTPALARRLGSGTLLIHGGGNLGDLWPHHQKYRESVIAKFPNNPIIQLPQTIHFQQPANLARARAVFNAHPRLTLLVRDQRSLEIARNEFRAASQLCPDMAFWLGPLRRPVAPTQEVLWLARTDKESVGGGPAGNDRIPRTDWLEEDPSTWLGRMNDRLTHWVWDRPRSLPWLRAPLSWTYNPLARQQVDRGCRILSASRRVITDRLHGHILCVLLGIPHAVLDNTYGKLRNFYETWTSACPLGRWCESAEEARSSAIGQD